MPRIYRGTADELRLAVSLDSAALGAAVGLTLDLYQVTLLRERERSTLFVASRQIGKSTSAALLILVAVLFVASAVAVLVAPTIRQARELFRKMRAHYRALGAAVPRIVGETTTSLEFDNDSRVIVVADDPETVRAYTADLVVIDEAAFVSDDTYHALTPMLAVTGGQLIALSTAKGRRGWFWKAWSTDGDEWLRLRVRATDCPRITPAFLARERARLGELSFAGEYGAEFTDSAGQFFAGDDIARAMDPGVIPYRRAQRAVA